MYHRELRAPRVQTRYIGQRAGRATSGGRARGRVGVAARGGVTHNMRHRRSASAGVLKRLGSWDGAGGGWAVRRDSMRLSVDSVRSDDVTEAAEVLLQKRVYRHVCANVIAGNLLNLARPPALPGRPRGAASGLPHWPMGGKVPLAVAAIL